MRLHRRDALLGLTACIGLGRAKLALADGPGDRRLVVILLRGALDGMAAVVPYGDPALPTLRGELLPPHPGQPDGLLDLGGFYGLHPALAGLCDLYRSNQALIVHAVAGAWRVRSHFEAQDCLESGADYRMTSGWLNRVVAVRPALPHAPAGDALAIGVSVPLLLRGAAPVANWAPHGSGHPAPDLYAAIAALNAADPVLGPSIHQGLQARGFSASVVSDQAGDHNAFAALARAAGEMLRAPEGPRIAALEIGGWDTHAAQTSRLPFPLKQLDAGLLSLRDGLGDAWAQAAVLVMTEFGRTARMNGTKGTDHGTGTVAFIAGGAVAGGRVLANWPGLGTSQLLENRDLAPTTDLAALAGGLLAEHLGISDPGLQAIFPASNPALRVRGIIRT